MPINKDLILKEKTNKKLSDLFFYKKEYESIFNELDNLKLFNQNDQNFLYGRIDLNNNPIFLNESFLKNVYSKNGVIKVCDIAAMALTDMQYYFAEAKNVLATNSNFIDIFAYKGYTPVQDQYITHLDNFYKLFFSFIDYTRNKNIKDIETFLEVFIEAVTYCIVKQQIPLTRTGFLTSKYCDFSSNGLTIDLLSIDKNDDQNKYDDIIKDDNFNFFLETASRFNFYVDKNIPSRLVFNLNSDDLYSEEPIEVCGGYKNAGYFYSLGIKSIEEFYETRYYKSMIGTTEQETDELYVLKTVFVQMYNTFVIPNQDFIFAKEDSRKNLKVLINTRDINYFDDVINKYKDNFWLKMLLYFRALETNQKWNQTEFNKYYSQVMILYKNYGIRESINYINVVTRNFFEVDKSSTNLIDRKSYVNKLFEEKERFKF